MKYSEFHRKIEKAGWTKISAKKRGKGSHYIYRKGENGPTISVPFHGSKEIGKSLQKEIEKQMGLR